MFMGYLDGLKIRKMITFVFKHSGFPSEDLEERKIKAEKYFLEYLGDFKSKFEKAETTVTVDLDNNKYDYNCKRDMGTLMVDFMNAKDKESS